MTLSINTNNAALAALESLSSTTSALNQTENQVSTGLKVSSASDNPAIYAIASTITGNISGLSAVSDSLSFGAQVVNTATKASADILSTLQTLQNTVTTAGTSGISQSTIESQVANAVNQINAYARSSTFNGVNVLTSTADSGAALGTANIVTGLQGSTLTIGNQATALGGGGGASAVLSNALGLTSNNFAAGATATATTQTVLNANSTGINIATASTLTEGSFAANSTVQLTNADGSTTTFEFVPSGTAATTANTTGANANTTVTILTSATDSASTSLGKLVNALNENGYNAALQTDGSLNITGEGVSAATSTVTGLGTTTGSVTQLSASAAAITTVQGAISKVDTISTTLGATTQEITGLQSFTSDLSDSLTAGVGGLTDADLSSASAKLTSLQTKQQLAIQSLSIANSQSQSILSLFRG